MASTQNLSLPGEDISHLIECVLRWFSTYVFFTSDRIGMEWNGTECKNIIILIST